MAEGRMTPAGLKTIMTAQANGRWQAAYSSLVAPLIPDDLASALQADPHAWDNFEKWTNSEKLQAVYWIAHAKRKLTRQKRVDIIVSLARTGHPFVTPRSTV